MLLYKVSYKLGIIVWETPEPSVKKFKKSVSRRKLVLLGLKNHQKKVSIANRWGKLSTAH